MDWLLKTEPEEYSWGDLEREKRTLWTGVTNPVAVKNIASMKKGDRAVIYHTGKERRAVGLAAVVGEPKPDPKNPRSAVVEIEKSGALTNPVPLEAIKAHPAFAESPLVRMGRLSVVPLTPAQYRFLTGG